MYNKKILRTINILVIMATMILTSTACRSVDANLNSNEVKEYSSFAINFLDPDEGVKVLANEDEYIKGFSRFDYMAKFKSEKMPNFEERMEMYEDNVLKWNEKEIEKIESVMSEIDKKIEKLNLNLPDEISIIKSNDWVESGASHTRGTSIVFSEGFINNSSESHFKTVFVHELFHIYSRYNKELRDELYGIINYERTEELVFPEEIKDLKISNPDAVENNYYIKCLYEGKEYCFIPVLYASEEYDISSNESFFKYVQDDMLAVEIKDGKSSPIYIDNKPLIVKKQDLENYYELIGNNTDYTYHPEETMADNFVFLVLDNEVESPWVLDKMRSFFEAR